MDAIYAKNKHTPLQNPFTVIRILEYLPHGDIIKQHRRINKYFNDAIQGILYIHDTYIYRLRTFDETSPLFFSLCCFVRNRLSVFTPSICFVSDSFSLCFASLLFLTHFPLFNYKDWIFSTITPCSSNVVVVALLSVEMDVISQVAVVNLPRIPKSLSMMKSDRFLFRLLIPLSNHNEWQQPSAISAKRLKSIKFISNHTECRRLRKNC